MRDKPEMLKTDLGMAAHREALKKVKGTPWERTLYPAIVDMQSEKALRDFRAAEQERLDLIKKRAEERAEEQFNADVARSEAFISSVKSLKKETGLTSAKDILKSLGYIGAPTKPKEEPDPDGAA